MNVSIQCDRCKGSAGVRGPCYVTSLGMNIKCEKWSPENKQYPAVAHCVSILLIILIPDLDHPLRQRGEEDVGQKGVPLDAVDGCVVRGEGPKDAYSVVHRCIRPSSVSTR